MPIFRPGARVHVPFSLDGAISQSRFALFCIASACFHLFDGLNCCHCVSLAYVEEDMVYSNTNWIIIALENRSNFVIYILVSNIINY